MKLFLLAWLMVCGVGSAHSFENTMAERTRACTACHGEQGQAGPDGYYPRLAGKPAGYLNNQLQNFKQGRRHYDLMARLIEPLSDAYLQDMALYFSGLKVPYPKPALTAGSATPAVLARGQALTLEGDASQGLPACVACHGDKLTGVAPFVPGLLGLPLDYLNGQLGAWQSGQRRAHAPDCMAQVVQRLSADDVMAVAHYLARLAPPSDASPARASQAGARAKLMAASDTWRCGSAPLAKGPP
ncbi:c-type cytochrome [Limnohabitans sp.]|uniref:c-type cytochrome n=1 Tax=Limnohabitans sp. TaxID=1907725 RepID=UPI0038B855EA